MALSANEQPEANRVGSMLKLLKQLGVFTDSNVAAADNKAGLIAVVNAATLPIGSSPQLKTQGVKAINVGYDLGILTDALVNPLTTVDGLVALTGVPATYQGRAFYD